MAACSKITSEFAKGVARRVRGTCLQTDRWNSSKPLTVENLNPFVRRMEYAVRGLIPIEAMKIDLELKQVRYGAAILFM